MGNALGNLLGLVILVLVAVVSLFSASVGIASFAVVAYGSWLFLWAADLATRPPRGMPLAAVLTSRELEAYRGYHTYLRFPAAAQAFSALLNLFRLAGFVWAGIAFWKGDFWLGGTLVAYFFLVGGACLRFDPVRYFVGPANSGNEIAREQLLLLKSVEEKRGAYYAN